MAVTITPITLASLTEAKPSGSGSFDVLMRAVKAHLDAEFTAGRIKGSDYATVYLGSLTAVLDQSVTFLMEKDKNALQSELIQAQIDLAKQQAANAVIEGQNLTLQGELLAAQKQNLDVERAFTIAKTALTEQQTANAVTENATMLIQQNLLTAQVLLAQAQKISTDAQSALVIQKTNTEKAQTIASGVDVDSVIGKQKALYQSQIDGFKRDAEQKAAKLLVDTWNVRRTTDEGTLADSTNKLTDSVVGAAVQKLLDGAGIVIA